MANSFRTKAVLQRKDDEPSPCLSCPKRQECLDKDATCSALREWQAKYRNPNRPRTIIYTPA